MKTVLRSMGIALALAMVTDGAAAQNQVTVPPGQDNTLYESLSGDVSNGAGTRLFAGTTARGGDIRRALLEFDIDGNVPAGATIDSVRLTMLMSRTISGDHLATLHRVLRGWGEGSSNADGQEGGGATATTGDATWLHSSFATQMWNSPGGDYEPTASGTASVGGVGTYTWGSSDGMVADVQGWLDSSANNFGWILIGDETTTGTAKRYDSRESSNPPQLQIYYSLSTSVEHSPETPGTVSLLASYPNPFTTSTSLEYTLSESRHVRLEVYDTLGRRITTLADGLHPAGRFTARFDAGDLPAGVYFYRIESGDVSTYRQVVLVR